MAHMQEKSYDCLRRDLCHVPISALALYRDSNGRLYVLAGEDTDLVVYEAGHESRCTSRVAVFDDQPIHGIHVQDEGILVWGSRSLAMLSLTGLMQSGAKVEEARVVVLVKTNAPDWIYHGAISPYDPNLAVVATSHNEILFLRFDSSTRQLTLGKPISPSRPMLFSAHLAWLSEDCVLVAGGTVFGHVVVWKHHLALRGDPGAVAATEMLFNFQGHEGSIYGVDISSPMTLPDGTEVRLLSSCSDDRTIHIWNISDRTAEKKSLQEVEQAIDTGFGSRPVRDNSTPSAGDNDPVAVAMGHASRIWGVKFGPADADGKGVAIYSFGEDSTAQRWSLRLSKSPTVVNSLESEHILGQLTHARTFALHNGKHLWSNAVLIERDKVQIATGGADSQICLIEEANTVNADSQSDTAGNHITLDVHDIINNSSPHAEAAAAKEIISRYDFIAQDQILVTTSQGRLFLSSLLTKSRRPTWQNVEIDDDSIAKDMRFGYILKGVGLDSALLGTTSGNLYHFNISTQRVSHIASVPSKVVDISILSLYTNGTSDTNSVEVLVHLHGTAESHYITLNPSTGMILVQEQIKGLDPRFVALSAIKIDGLLFVGSRHGFLSILDRDLEGTYRPILNMASRSKDGITAILPLPRKSGAVASSGSHYILTTSRDGKYRIYEMDRQMASVHLHLRHETSPPFGPTIAGAWFTQDKTPELILYGFRSKDFVIWNETRREELVTVECGGAHRTYQLAYSISEPWRYRFAFTKASKLSISLSESVAHRWIKTGTHGREIRTLSYNGQYLATGAEDTSIRIWELQPQDDGRTETRCVATMKAHITGLQKLAWFEDNYLFSSAGNEEFFVWKICRFESDYSGLAIVCEGSFTDKSVDGDLRIMDFDVSRPERGDGLLITMALSNSTLKTYRYTSEDGSFELYADGTYTRACLTQTRNLDMGDGFLCVLTASTDGHLALWQTEPGETEVRKFVLKQVVRLHQSSIKGLDVINAEGGRCVFTGGDDNGVGVTFLNQTLSSAGTYNWAFSRRSCVRRAHTAAVPGVAIMRRRTGLIGVSVSNDQRIKMWAISEGTGTSSTIELLQETVSGVADPGDIVLVDRPEVAEARVLVGGVGVEAWSWLT